MLENNDKTFSRAKIIDFGTAIMIELNEMLVDGEGTYTYMAPEVLIEGLEYN